MYADGVGLRHIAVQLNQEGVPAPVPAKNRDRQAWSRYTIREMLHNERYRGILVWDRTNVGGAERRGQFGSATEDHSAADGWQRGWPQFVREQPRPRCGRKRGMAKAGGSRRRAIDSGVCAEPDLLCPGEECDSPPRHELPGATLPWALSRILHARPKIGNGRQSRTAARERAAVC